MEVQGGGRNNCEKCSFSSLKGKVTLGTKKLRWIQGWRTFHHTSRRVTSKHSTIDLQILLLQWLFKSLFLLIFFSPVGLAYAYSGNVSIEKQTAPLWDTEHLTWEAAALLGTAYTYPLQTGKLEAPNIQGNWGLFLPQCSFALKLVKCHHLIFPSNFYISFF